MPPRRHQHANGGAWWRQQITVGNMINFGMIAFAAAGFYFNTGARLDGHDKLLEGLKQKITAQEVELRRSDSVATAEREKARTEFLTRVEKTNEGIAELNKKTAVLEVQLGGIKDVLVRIEQGQARSAITPR